MVGLAESNSPEPHGKIATGGADRQRALASLYRGIGVAPHPRFVCDLRGDPPEAKLILEIDCQALGFSEVAEH